MTLQPATPTLLPGFEAPVSDAQRVFKTVMRAMSRPGTIVTLETELKPPAPLTPEMAAILLALADHETPLWMEPCGDAASATAFLTFHTGLRLATALSAAAFVAVAPGAPMPALDALAQGTPEFPDRSATLLVAVSGFQAGGLQLVGPGIDGRIAFGFEGMPADFADTLARNRAGYPCGVDIVLAAPGALAALPRSVCLAEGA